MVLKMMKMVHTYFKLKQENTEDPKQRLGIEVVKNPDLNLSKRRS
jgi:hypothetical protein